MFVYEKPGLKVLPYTNNRYKVSDELPFRLVDNLTGKFVNPNIFGRYELSETIYGELDYEELWMLTHKPLNIDLLDFVKVYPEFKDIEIVSKPDTEVNKSTRFWKFKRIESRTFKDHFYIPGFTNYVINENGEIISLFSGEVMEIHVANTGYPSVRLTRDDRRETVIPLHRLLVATFKDWGSDANELHVDHLNGDKLDFSLQNLDLVNQGTNKRRAVENGFYKTDELKEIFLRDLETGDTGTFTLISDLARYIGIDAGTIGYHLRKPRQDGLIKSRYFVAYRIKNGRGRYVDGFTGDIGTNKFLDRDNFRYRDGSQPRPVLVKDVIRNIVTKYDSVVKMITSTGLSRKQAYENLKQSTQKRYGDIIFKYEDDIKEWII